MKETWLKQPKFKIRPEFKDVVKKVDLSIEYTPGDATRTQLLKEVGLTWDDYAKAMLSLEEFIALIEKTKEEGKKSVYKDNYYKHYQRRLTLRKKYYQEGKKKEHETTDK